MTKRTRLFVFVAVGILVAGLGTGLLASYMGGIQNLVLIGGNGPADLAYVPADAKAVKEPSATAANSSVFSVLNMRYSFFSRIPIVCPIMSREDASMRAADFHPPQSGACARPRHPARLPP